MNTKPRGIPYEKIAIVALLAYCVFPFYFLVLLSMRKGGESGGISLLPTSWSWTNYDYVFHYHDFMSGFTNSVIVSGSATALALLIGGIAGYALARLQVPGKQYILFSCLAVSMFPAISIVGPLFEMWRSLGLFDTKLGLIIPSVTFSLPMGIWIMASFFRELPRDLEHAAYMDGATPFQAFRKVMLPLAAPGVFTAAILIFIGAWNEFMFAISFTATEKSRTIPAAIASFQGRDAMEIPVGSISAASVVVMLPLIAAVLAFQRRIVSGLTAGGVKG